MKRLTFIFSTLTLVAMLIGCGGGESSLSKAEFIKRADAICQKADETEVGEFGAYVRSHPSLTKNLNQTAVHEKVFRAIAFPSILKEAEDIEALGAPSGDEKTIEEFLAGIRKAVKEAEKDPTRLEEDLPNGEGKNGEYAFREVNKLANEYGFKQCNEVV